MSSRKAHVLLVVLSKSSWLGLLDCSPKIIVNM